MRIEKIGSCAKDSNHSDRIRTERSSTTVLGCIGSLIQSCCNNGQQCMGNCIHRWRTALRLTSFSRRLVSRQWPASESRTLCRSWIASVPPVCSSTSVICRPCGVAFVAAVDSPAECWFPRRRDQHATGRQECKQGFESLPLHPVALREQVRHC